MGRPSKLTAEIQTKICERVAAGSYPEIAAVAVGVHRATFYRWMAQGRKAKRGVFRDFRDAIKKAAADAEVSDLAEIEKAGHGGQVLERKTITRTKRDGTTETEVIEKFSQGQWTALAWKLERRCPLRWGKREQQVLVKLAQELKELQKRWQARNGGTCRPAHR